MSQQRTVLITGASGLLGRAVANEFVLAGWRTVGTAFSRLDQLSSLLSQTTVERLDLTEPDAIATLLDRHRPALVVHSAAQRAPDAVANDPNAARALNVAATAGLAAACAARDVPCVYISTDYVFSGAPGEAPYTERSQTGPTNLYGELKLSGEMAILDATAADASGFVLRVPVLYGKVHPDGNHAESAVNVLVDAVWRAQKEQVRMDDWSKRYPTCTEDVGRVLVGLAAVLLGKDAAEDATTRRKRWQAVGNGTRILQFSSEQCLTKYQLSQLIAGILGLPLDQMLPERDLGGRDAATGVQRPYDCHLSTDGLKHLGVDVQTQDVQAWFRRYLNATR